MVPFSASSIKSGSRSETCRQKSVSSRGRAFSVFSIRLATLYFAATSEADFKRAYSFLAIISIANLPRVLIYAHSSFSTPGSLLRFDANHNPVSEDWRMTRRETVRLSIGSSSPFISFYYNKLSNKCQLLCNHLLVLLWTMHIK